MHREGGHIARPVLIALCLVSFVLQFAVASAQDASSPSPDRGISPPSTIEIPPATLPQSQGVTAPAAAPPDLYNSGVGISNNQVQVPPAELRHELQSLHDFIEEGDATSSLGMVLREAHRGVKGSGEVAGLLVIEVIPGTPAAYAGLRGLHTGINSVLSGAALAASFFFPPAMLAAAVVSGMRLGESYDLIIGLDSQRVTNYLDFSGLMSRARAGDVVYLSVSRNGERLQIKVPLSGAAFFGSQ
jgi:S1-C subfamily serine protease